MDNGFADRLVDQTYAKDEVCQVRLEPDTRDESRAPRETWVSERLLARLRLLGLAYELPLLSRIPQSGSTVYPEQQILSLEDELAFVFGVISDPPLLRAIAPIHELIRIAAHESRGWSLTVETP